MINFIIVEDNVNHRKKVKDIILAYMMNNKVEFNIVEYADCGKMLLSYLKNNVKDDTVYILDLELPSGDGIDIARLIRNTYNDWKSPIIICTAHSSLAFETYKQRLQILDFVSKCEEIEKNIKEALDICMKMFDKNSFYRYTYHNVDNYIPYSTIDYIQRESRRIIIVTNEKNYYQNISITNIKKTLPNYFVVSSKGTLLNMKNVKQIDWNEMLVYFKDGKSDYVISNTHKREISHYEVD